MTDKIPDAIPSVPIETVESTRLLSELEPDELGTVCEVSGSGALRKRLLDMGMVPGAEIEVVRVAPLGDPVEYMVKGYRLSLRRSEAASVIVRDLPCEHCLNQDCPRHGRGRRMGRWRRWRQRWLGWMQPQPANNGRLPLTVILEDQAQSEENSRDNSDGPTG